MLRRGPTKAIKVVIRSPRLCPDDESESDNLGIGITTSPIVIFWASEFLNSDKLSRAKTTLRIDVTARMLSKSSVGGTLRPGIKLAPALFVTARTAATEEARTGAMAEGIGAVARAVEIMEPTSGPAGATGGIDGTTN